MILLHLERSVVDKSLPWSSFGLVFNIELLSNLVYFNLNNVILLNRRGFGVISAAGGKGWGGGGGGRISLNCYSKQEDVKITVHG